MLETVLMYLNNWFAVGRYDDTYTIESLPSRGAWIEIAGLWCWDGKTAVAPLTGSVD